MTDSGREGREATPRVAPDEAVLGTDEAADNDGSGAARPNGRAAVTLVSIAAVREPYAQRLLDVATDITATVGVGLAPDVTGGSGACRV